MTTRRAAISTALVTALLVGLALSSITHDWNEANPFAASALPRSERFVFEGDVEERVLAGPYVYQRVEGTWVASLALTTPVDVPRVTVTAVGRAHDFYSPRLTRHFETLVFGIVRPAS
jgi:hypothetical protein